MAIDFTGSNGDPRKPGTLHHINPNGLNGYEKAITAVGGILSKYDTDQSFPVWGFGAKYDGVVRHCFQVGRSKEVHGVNGILEAYRGVFKTALTMSGPTVFTEVIELAAAQAISRQQLKPLSYTILLLLTDGAVSDVEATKRTLQSVADAPLSIVIVGIGNADFSAMQFLDDFETRNNFNRDIVQFVEFRNHEHDKMSLTRATLDEIPEQLVQFFHARGIMPQTDTNFSASKIFVEDVNEHEEEIDLSMDYNPDGEIVLNGDQSAAYIDTHSYQSTGMPVPIPPPAVASAAAVPVQQPFTFQVQCPPGVNPGMQLQVQHPKTGQMLIVAVPQGVQPGGVFNVSA